MSALSVPGYVAVLLGGTGAEREISLQSGGAVLDALLAAGVEAVAIDTGEVDLIEALQARPPAIAFIALHGRGGEDGTVQAVLETLGVPYTGSAVLGSALAMDKLRSKQIWLSQDLPTAAYEILHSDSDFARALERLGGKVCVKPVREGSSVGMAIVDSADALERAWRDADRYDDQVMAERFIAGDEYTVAVLHGHSLPSIRIVTERSFYDYQAKYRDDDTRLELPSGLSDEDEARIQALAIEAFELLDCAHWGRVDFIRDKSSQAFVLLEVNTVPGLTDHSLVPRAAAAQGMSLADLALNIIQLGLERAGKC